MQSNTQRQKRDAAIGEIPHPKKMMMTLMALGLTARCGEAFQSPMPQASNSRLISTPYPPTRIGQNMKQYTGRVSATSMRLLRDSGMEQKGSNSRNISSSGFDDDENTSRIILGSVNSSSETAKESLDVTQSPPSPSILEAEKALALVSHAEKEVYQSAIYRTLAWVAAACAFGVGLGVAFSPEVSEEFFAGYLVEQSLSVDNLFVFLLLFEYFNVPLESQDRVLNWGIIGAIVMRAVMIGLGAAALQNFHEILLVFAGILVYSSAKSLIPEGDEDKEDPSENTIVKFSQGLINSTQQFDGDRFFTLVDGVKKATPLFICMIAVEISDVVFAVDSIPAVFGVTENPIVVFTSNMFAIMGLRSLYTILSKAAQDLEYLEPAVAVVLGFIGFKMIAEYFGYGIPTEVALAVVAGLLSTGIGLSVWEKRLAAEDEVQ